MNSKENFIKELVNDFFDYKDEMQRLLLTNYISNEVEVLLANDYLNKKNMKLADFLAVCVYKREKELLNQVMDITDKDLEKESKND